jgi:hypothetical protein
MAVKNVSWELSPVSGTVICPGPVCADIITLEGCCFFGVLTQVSSAFATKGDDSVTS